MHDYHEKFNEVLATYAGDAKKQKLLIALLAIEGVMCETSYYDDPVGIRPRNSLYTVKQIAAIVEDAVSKIEKVV